MINSCKKTSCADTDDSSDSYSSSNSCGGSDTDGEHINTETTDIKIIK